MTIEDFSPAISRSKRAIARFLRDTDGAVTVDWVALTGFTIVLGMGAAFYVATSVPRVADKIGEHLEDTPVSTGIE